MNTKTHKRGDIRAPKGIDWDAIPLGMMTDQFIGEKLGVNHRVIFRERKKRGVSPWRGVCHNRPTNVERDQFELDWVEWFKGEDAPGGPEIAVNGVVGADEPLNKIFKESPPEVFLDAIVMSTDMLRARLAEKSGGGEQYRELAATLGIGGLTHEQTLSKARQMVSSNKRLAAKVSAFRSLMSED